MSTPILSMTDRIRDILATDPVGLEDGTAIGESRSGRSLHAFRLGHGETNISLIGGCHADEPVGPRLLCHLVAYLRSLPTDHEWLSRFTWWIVPHVNPDGAAINASWSGTGADFYTAPEYDLTNYLSHVVRELPGDDIEFGFPRDRDDQACRPENRAVYDWWQQADRPFKLHASLHGMAFAAGPWFLFERSWLDRSQLLQQTCVATVQSLGYELHDVERHGEKGFHRLARGFCSRPDSRAMAAHFQALDDHETANKFRPSSMETVRSFGGDPLTLVSEMPLFITPGVGRELGPPDLVAREWKDRIADWRLRLAQGLSPADIRSEAADFKLRPMPVADQMVIQWTFIVAGLATATA